MLSRDRNQFGRISLSPVSDDGGHGATGDTLDSLDNFTHGTPMSGTQIQRNRLAIAQVFQRLHMGIRQVGDMNIVANAGSVGGRVVIAHDLERPSCSA